MNEVLRSTGQPLDGATRSFMESRFGHDFAPVRVHADPRAAESASSVKARAYTVGAHIVFGAGEYVPSSRAGRQLIAHELAHVVQQTGANGQAPKAVVQRVPTVSILDENFIGRPSATQRHAAKSCPINAQCNSYARQAEAAAMFPPPEPEPTIDNCPTGAPRNDP